MVFSAVMLLVACLLLCNSDDEANGQKFKGFSRPAWWPAEYEWGGRGIDMMSVDAVDLVLEKLLKKKEAKLVGVVGFQYLHFLAHHL